MKAFKAILGELQRLVQHIVEGEKTNADYFKIYANDLWLDRNKERAAKEAEEKRKAELKQKEDEKKEKEEAAKKEKEEAAKKKKEDEKKAKAQAKAMFGL